MTDKPRIKIPATATKGQVIEIKTMVQHPMESGLRKDPAGNIIPRKIINKMTCTFNGKPCFETALHQAIAANPYLAFFAKVNESGVFEFSWTDEDGTVLSEKASIAVS